MLMAISLFLILKFIKNIEYHQKLPISAIESEAEMTFISFSD
jgi:hypothetical protein